MHVTSEIDGLPFLKFDILEVKPSSPFKSVCLINTDVEIDFAPPLDYVEPAPPSPKRNKAQEVEEEAQDDDSSFREFRGTYRRLDGKPVTRDPTKKIEKDEFDPRKHRLVHGVRRVD